MKPNARKDWPKVAGILIGLVAGYLNFRAAMTFFFVISNTDTPLVLLAILGYAGLLPLTIIGFAYPSWAAKFLLLLTVVAFACGLVPSPVLQAAIHMGLHFVLPNFVVAALFIVYGRRHRVDLQPEV